jgi:uncharacterized protein
MKMGFRERLLEDMHDAMRSKNNVRRDAIRMIRSGIQYAEADRRLELVEGYADGQDPLDEAGIEKQISLNEADIEALIAKEVKKRHQAIEMFAQGGRQDLVDAELESVAYLEAYLPQPLSEAEMEALVKEVVSDLGATSMSQMGAVMREALSRAGDRADGKKVSQLVRSLLSS